MTTQTTFTCVACGDTYTYKDELAMVNAGVVTELLSDKTGTHERKYCYLCAANFDRANAHETGELFAYVRGLAYKETPHNDRFFRPGSPYVVADKPCLTTWPGIPITTINGFRAWRANFGDVRISFRFTLDGELWHGTYYASAGDYARCKRNKKQAIQAAQTTGGK